MLEKSAQTAWKVTLKEYSVDKNDERKGHQLQAVARHKTDGNRLNGMKNSFNSSINQEINIPANWCIAAQRVDH